MSIDFESLTDAEINRWVAVQFVTLEMAQTWGGFDRAIDAMIDHEGDWATSADAALELCERWGLRVDLLSGQGGLWYCAIGVFTGRAATAARALLNAACAAMHAKEMADAAN